MIAPYRGRHRAARRSRPLPAIALTLAGLTLATPAIADPLSVDELGGTRSGVAVAAPAEAPDQAFGSLGFTGITPAPEPEPEPEPEPASDPEPAAVAEEGTPTAALSSTTTTQTVDRIDPPSRSADRAPAPKPEPTPAPPSNGGVLGIAASYVGTPYVLGATGPSTFDCSGYTSYVFAQVGINLPRTAQQAYATPVTNPQPGDLVFWGYPAYHVGIYAGNGMVYDAGNPGTGVIYRSVFSGVSGYGRV